MGNNKFVRLKREYGSEIDHALRKVIIADCDRYLGRGGYICDMQDKVGNIESISLSVVFYQNTKEENVLIQKNGQEQRIVSDDELKNLKFCFNNLDY